MYHIHLNHICLPTTSITSPLSITIAIMIPSPQLFPTCQVRVVRFLHEPPPSFFLPSSFLFLLLAGHHLPARECSETRRTSSATSLASSWLQWVLAGLHLPLRWAARASSWSPWVSPDFCSATVSVGLAGLLRLENRYGLQLVSFGPRRTLGTWLAGFYA